MKLATCMQGLLKKHHYSPRCFDLIRARRKGCFILDYSSQRDADHEDMEDVADV